MTLQWPPKAPAEVLDYDIDWSKRLTTGDTIASSTWSASPNDLTLSGQTFTSTLTKVFLTGGTAIQTYNVVNTITTAFGDTMVETVLIAVAPK